MRKKHLNICRIPPSYNIDLSFVFKVQIILIFFLKVDSGYVCEGDHKTIAKAIKDRVSLFSRKREQRKLVREEQEKRKRVQENDSSKLNTTAKPPGPALASVIMESEEHEADQQLQQHGASASS